MNKNLKLILESEKNHILRLHENEKKRWLNIINEQTGGDTEVLKKAQELGCSIAKNTELRVALGQPDVLYKKADYNSPNGYFKIGDELYIFGNYTFDVVKQNPSEGEEEVIEGLRWSCDKLKDYFEGEQRQKKSKTPESLETQNLKDAGWKHIDTLRLSGLTPDEIYLLWEPHQQYKQYFKPKYASNRTGKFSPDQQKFVNYWTAQINNGIDEGMFMVNPTTDEFISGGWDMDKYFIVPDSKNFFAGGLKVYYNTNKKTEPTRQMCKTVIKKFADEYNRNRTATKVTKDTFTKKVYIQDCIYKFKEFDRPLSGVKDELNLLGGMVEGGARAGTPYYIKLERKL